MIFVMLLERNRTWDQTQSMTSDPGILTSCLILFIEAVSLFLDVHAAQFHRTFLVINKFH